MTQRSLGQLYVALQFGLLAALAVLCALQFRNSLPSWISWLLWVASGSLGLWTLAVNRPGNFHIHPEPRPDGQLVQAGPYRWVRHPMYVAVLLFAAGCSAWLVSIGGWVLFAVLLGVLVGKASLEEQWLLQRYPNYADYCARTWRLIPWIY